MLTIKLKVDDTGLAKLQQLGSRKLKGTLRDIIAEGGERLKQNTHERNQAEETPNYRPMFTPSSLSRNREGSTQKFRGGPLLISIPPTRARIGGFHQGGAPKMAARPFMGISAKDEEDVRQIALRHLRSLMR